MENNYLNQNNPNTKSNNFELRNKGHNFFEYLETQIKNVPQIAKDRLEFKRKMACKEAKFNDFETYESTKSHPGEYHGNILYKIVKSKSKNKSSIENEKLNKILKNTYLETTTIMVPNFKIADYSKNFFDLKSVTSSYDDEEFDTAEIEAILNGIKHREIEMVVEHDPSITSLITSTVNDLTYRSTLYSHKNTLPSDISPEYLNKEKRRKITKKHPKIKYQLLNHIFARSIKQEVSTPPQNTECKLQDKIKNVFEAVKKKIAHDYNKEVIYTKTSLKKMYKDITNKLCNITNTSQKELPPSTKSISKNTLNKTTPKLRYSRSTERYTSLSNKKNTHTIPILGDDFSMLTIFEQLLSKAQEQNVINILTTNVPANEISSRYKKNSTDINQEIIDELEYPNANLDQYYVEKKSDKASTRKFDDNMESDSTTEDMSFEALSNKLSYNDYVNGYKYYLNFQKQQNDNKFSNLIRYQAHKHHKVDDIGKYILNKIPQLPTTRIKRNFVEPETLEDQDVSTKSEDSWFKKHFFLFLDTDPSKKFHSTQTITCKDNDFIKNNKQLRYCTLASSKNKTFEGENHNCSGQMITKNYIKYKRNINERYKNDDINQFQKKNQKLTLSNNINENPLRKYTNIPLSTRSTTAIKLQKKKKQKPIRVFHFFHRKGKQKHKREDQTRVQRFNFLKGVKDIFKDSPKYSHLRQEKLFDYEIMSSSKPHHDPNMRNRFKIEEMLRQIPNISSNFESIYPFFDLNYNKLNEDSLTYTKDNVYSTLPSKLCFDKRPCVDDKESDFWFSYGTDKQKQFKLTSAPYANSNKPSLPVQMDNNDLIYANFKTDLSQENFNFPVTLSSLNTIIKDDEIKNKYRIKLATHQPTKLKNANPETEKIYTLKSTTINSIDKGMTKILLNLKDSTLENSYTMYKNSENEYNRDKIFAENKNKNNIGEYKKLPEQYFSTPLPMKIKEFNTFLREHQLDVESVTATLRNSVSFSADKTLDKWKMSKKYVPKSISFTNYTNFLGGKQFNVKVAKENKEKQNVKLIGVDYENIKQGRYDDLKYADIKDNLDKDAFRFTSMKTYGSYIDNTSTVKTTKTAKPLKYPKKIQVSGHNYKYDIIFHNMKKKKRNFDNM